MNAGFIESATKNTFVANYWGSALTGIYNIFDYDITVIAGDICLHLCMDTSKANFIPLRRVLQYFTFVYQNIEQTKPMYMFCNFSAVICYTSNAIHIHLIRLHLHCTPLSYRSLDEY